YVFVYPDEVEQYIDYYKDWKNSLGYEVIKVKKSEAGATADDIKNYLSNLYFNSTNSFDYVIMFGDVDGDLSIPSFIVEGGSSWSPLDVSDHKFTVIDGDDYFPDFMLGRVSFRDLQTLGSTIIKLINYEKQPYTSNQNWFNRAVLTAYTSCYPGDGTLVSGAETLREVGLKLKDFNYEIDSLFTPNIIDPSNLSNLINPGCSMLAYRGQGAENYWFLDYDIDDIENLQNGSMLPFVTSIVCGGGDFANTDFPTCFGEKWLSAGTANTPKGAIGFIGPSEWDTKTPFNNCNIMGIYQGFTQEGLSRCGELMLRGKMELYNNYPTMHEWGNALNSDQFYFYIYNLLGDPGLSVRSEFPEQLELEVLNTPNQGISNLEVQVFKNDNPVNEAWVSLKKQDGLICAYQTDESGIATLPADFSNSVYTIWASKDNTIPVSYELDLTNSISILKVYSQSLSSINNNETAQIEITLENISGEQLTGVEFSFNSDDGLVCPENMILAGDFSVGQTKTIQFDLTYNANWNLNERVSFLLSDTENSIYLNLSVEVLNPELVYSSYQIFGGNSHLMQNTTNNFKLELTNIGDCESGDLQLNLFNKSDNYEILFNMNSINSISNEDSGITDQNFSIEIGNLWNGDVLAFGLEIKKEDVVCDTINFQIPVGDVDETSPTWSNYGYVAIENSDVIDGVDPVQYNWFEIAPALGGFGSEIYSYYSQIDGIMYIKNLPFNFMYYGQDFDNISVCSNGYAVMGYSTTVFFRNRTIPSGVGTKNMIAPFWDDLEDGKVYTYFKEDTHEFYIQWYNVKSAYDESKINNFQLILRDPEYYPTETGDGEMIFIYKEIHNIDV
ncbi:MAG: hypothetical protein JXR48_07915, partial [Candidatus Delongbacteria bacterium]|nr:hypothetical protein [Candidatus Delongbacteria bacterium]